MTRIDQALEMGRRIPEFTWRDLHRELKLDYAACKRVLQRMRARGLVEVVHPSVGGGDHINGRANETVFRLAKNPPPQVVRPRGRPPKARTAPLGRPVSSVWDLAR